MTKTPHAVTRLLTFQTVLLGVLFTVLRIPLSTLGFLLLFFLPGSIFVGRRLYSPLRDLLKRVKNPVDRISDQELTRSEPEDWAELEFAFDQIQTDLKVKTDTLMREREELATLMSALSEAILAVDVEGNLMFFNSRFAFLFLDKVEKDPRANRACLGEIFRAPALLQAFEKVLKEGAHQQIDVPLFVKHDAIARHFSLSVAPLKRENGATYGAIGVFHDVTELKKAEKIRIDFVANVSHELRTPLTSIKGYTETLRQDLERQDYRSADKFIEVISRNANRLMRLIEDLLDLSSLESSEANEEVSQAKSEVDLRELTTKVLQQLELRRAEKNHTIETFYEADGVHAEPERTEQVLVNLLENAIKYTPSAGKLTVRWARSPEAVRLHVSDNGPGIPAEHQPRLFERFYRVDQARSRELGGTGLGLAIVKHIMQRHGGSAWVVSELGKGSEFICEFPRG
jgi:two-component system phosphate regulon sensor histidine kinase PhoR